MAEYSFEDALQKLCDIRPAFDQGNLYLEALLELLQYTTHDASDVIGWWLYEAPKDDPTVSWIEDGVGRSIAQRISQQKLRAIRRECNTRWVALSF